MERRFVHSSATRLLVLIGIVGGATGFAIRHAEAKRGDVRDISSANVEAAELSRVPPDTADRRNRELMQQLLSKSGELLDSILDERSGRFVVAVRSTATQEVSVLLLAIERSVPRILTHRIALHVEDEFPRVSWAPPHREAPQGVMLIWDGDGEWPTFAQVLSAVGEGWIETWRTQGTGCIAPVWKDGARGEMKFVAYTEQLTDDCLNPCYERLQSIVGLPLGWPITYAWRGTTWQPSLPLKSETDGLKAKFDGALDAVHKWPSGACSTSASRAIERLTAWSARAAAPLD